MAPSGITLPDSAVPDSTPIEARRLSRGTIGLGEQALRICEELVATAAAIIRDNRKLMQTGKRIRKRLGSAPRERLFRARVAAKLRQNRCN
jgi:hypothetical protein